MIGKTIARYEVQAEIGSGGMAVVYLAYDPKIRRNVAIKLVTSLLQDETVIQQRFEREAQLIARIEHPAIVPVYDYGEQDGQPFLVMRYMQGGSLAVQIKQGKRTLEYASQVFTQIAPALDAVHAQGIVHRDIKPGNILLDGFGNHAISDFGIAHFSAATANLTGSAIIGTPAYMSPEQVRGDVELDGRSDIYALGMLLYEIFTGHGPFQATTPLGVAMKHLTDPIPSIRSIRPDLPLEMEHVLNRALAKQRELRYGTTTEMMRELQKIATGAGGITSSPPSAVHTPRPDELPTEALDVPQSISPAETIKTAHVDPQPAPPRGTAQPPRRSAPQLGRVLFVAGVGLLLFILCGSLGLFGTWAGVSGLFARATTTVQPVFTPTSPPPSAAPESTPTIQDVILLTDDFSDIGSGWPTTGENSQGEYRYLSDAYRLKVTRSGGVLWVTTDAIYDNISVHVDANPLLIDANGYYGLLCRVVDERNFYYFLIGNNGEFDIGKYQDNVFQSLFGEDWRESAAIQQGTRINHLRADCLGNALRLYVNDTLIGEATDSDFTRGKSGMIAAGLDAHGYEVLFDNFLITQAGQ